MQSDDETERLIRQSRRLSNLISAVLWALAVAAVLLLLASWLVW